MKKMLCTGTFGLALLCFCLPWVTVSCQQQKMITTTGVQLVSGMELAEPGSGMFGGPQKKHKVEPNGLAIVALIAAVAGVGLSLAGGRASVLPALAGVAAAIALKANLDQEILKEGHGLFQVTYEAGFAGYLVTMGLGVVTAFAPEASPAQVPVRQADDDCKKCPQCAEQIRKDAVVCRHCSTRLVAAEGAAQPDAPWVPPVPAACESFVAFDTGASPALAPAAAMGPEPRFCFQCGTAVIEGSQFCIECGVRLASSRG